MERMNEIIEYINPSGEIKQHTFEEMETNFRWESCDEDFHIKCSQEESKIEMFKGKESIGTFKMEPRFYDSIMFRIHDEMEMEGRIEETFLEL